MAKSNANCPDMPASLSFLALLGAIVGLLLIVS